MKILFILCFACLAVFSYAGEQERRVKFDSHNYCEALNKASALFSDTNPRSRKGKDPMERCGKKCSSRRLNRMWMPKKLENRTSEDVVTYYNLYRLQNWLAAQSINGCLKPTENFTPKNCKLPCKVIELAEEEIQNLFDDYFQCSNSRLQSEKMKKKAMEILQGDRKTQRKIKKLFDNNIMPTYSRSVKKMSSLAAKMSSCLLHTQSVVDKLTAPCG